MITSLPSPFNRLNEIGYVKDARIAPRNGKPREGIRHVRQPVAQVAGGVYGTSSWRYACGLTDTNGNEIASCGYPWWSMLLWGTEPVYRLIRNHHTAAIARYVVLGPVRANTWDVTWEDERFKDHPAVKWIRTEIFPMRLRVMRDAVRCFDYGYQPFAIPWSIRDGFYVPDVRALLPEATTVLMDGTEFAGIENHGIEGGPKRFNNLESWVPSLDGEAGYPYGRSRYENIRDTAWAGWLNTATKGDKLQEKLAGIIPLIFHPPGGSEDEDGTAVSFRDSARTALNELWRGNGVALETIPFTPEEIMDEPKLAHVPLFSIDFVKTGDVAQSLSGFISQLEYWDKAICRGLLVPERSILEAVAAGSRADSESHGDVRVADSEAIDADLTESFDRNVVQTALRLNFGEDVARQVRLVSAPMLKWKQQVFREVMGRLVSVPALAVAVAQSLDMKAIFGAMSLPQLKEFVVDASLLKPAQGGSADEKPDEKKVKEKASVVAMALKGLE